MSDLFTILLLLLPIVIVIALLNISQKRHKKRKEEGFINYLNQIKNDTGLTASFQKLLLNQMIVLDEVNKKLLVIDRQDEQYSNIIFNLNELKSCSIKHVNETTVPGRKDERAETYTRQLGLEIVTTGKDQLTTLIVFFDHAGHNILLKSEKEKEASDFLNRITRVIKK